MGNIEQAMNEHESAFDINNVKQLEVNHKDLLEVLQLIHIHKKVSSEQIELVDDVVLMEAIVWEIFDRIELSEATCSFIISNENRFALWLVIDKYVTFCKEHSHEDLVIAERLKSIFGN